MKQVHIDRVEQLFDYVFLYILLNLLPPLS